MCIRPHWSSCDCILSQGHLVQGVPFSLDTKRKPIACVKFNNPAPTSNFVSKLRFLWNNSDFSMWLSCYFIEICRHRWFQLLEFPDNFVQSTRAETNHNLIHYLLNVEQGTFIYFFYRLWRCDNHFVIKFSLVYLSLCFYFESQGLWLFLESYPDLGSIRFILACFDVDFGYSRLNGSTLVCSALLFNLNQI